MTTRSQTNTPTSSLNLSLTTSDPTTYQQASTNPHCQQAMSIEIQALQKQNTWILVPKPQNRPILDSKWTYKTKLNLDGSIARYKARLVAQGYRQTHGIDYLDTFSPVAKIPAWGRRKEAGCMGEKETGRLHGGDEGVGCGGGRGGGKGVVCESWKGVGCMGERKGQLGGEGKRPAVWGRRKEVSCMGERKVTWGIKSFVWGRKGLVARQLHGEDKGGRGLAVA